MAKHYASPAKARSHAFMLEELDRHGIRPKRVLTLPSVDGHCALAIRKHYGETISSQRQEIWSEPAPTVKTPQIHITGIERQSMIVLRSTMVERGILQDYWATTVQELVSDRSAIRVGTLGANREQLAMAEVRPGHIIRYDLLNLDFTCLLDDVLLQTIHRAAAKLLAPGGLVAVTTLAGRTAQYGSGEHREHHYHNASSALTLTCWKPQ